MAHEDSSVKDMEHLLRQRRKYRSAVTKLVNKVDEYYQAGNSPPVDILSSLQSRYHEIHQELQRVDEQLDPLYPEHTYDVETAEADEYLERLSLSKARLDLWAQNPKWQHKSSAATTSSNQSGNQARSNNGSVQDLSTAISHSVKLPKLTLPTFEGKLREWEQFYSAYQRMVHQNQSLSDLDRFTYLRSCLKGGALLAISALKVIPENYKVAIDLLLKRYHRPEAQMQEHLRELLATKPVQNPDDVKGLRRLYDHLIMHVTGLHHLQLEESSYEVVLFEVLNNSVPRELRLGFRERQRLLKLQSTLSSSGSSTPSSDESIKGRFGEFLEYLLEQIELREESDWPTTSTSAENSHSRPTSKHSKWKDRRRNHPASSASVLATNVSQVNAAAPTRGSRNPSKPVKTHTCIFCKGKHWSSECDVVMSNAERKGRLRETSRCFSCFRTNHTADQCKHTGVKCEKCGGPHWTIICDVQSTAVLTRALPPDANRAGTDPIKVCLTMFKNSVLLMTARVWLSGPKGKVLARLVLDSASQRTFVRADIAHELGLPVFAEEDLRIDGFGNSTQFFHSRQMKLSVTSQYGGETITVDVAEVPEPCKGELPSASSEIMADLKHQGFHLADANVKQVKEWSKEIAVLIGMDQYWQFVTGEVCKITDGLAVINTKFGWCIAGPEDSPSNPKSVNSVMCAVTTNAGWHLQYDEVDKTLQRFWEIEHIGITAEVKDSNSDEINQQLTSSICQVAGRYQVSLPWKSAADTLASNYEVAEGRLKRVIPKLRREHLLQRYQAEIEGLLERGHAEVVPSDTAEGPRVYYMPHRGVLREDKVSSKLRVVFDASSSAPGEQSLNELLEAGPNLNPLMIQILLNFRTKSCVIFADVERAFLQILVAVPDQDALRFIWPKDPENYPWNPEVVILRMKVVPFGLTCSPFILAAVIHHHLDQCQGKYPRTVLQLQDSLYVDDVLETTNTIAEGLLFKQEAEEVFHLAKMTLHRWQSNKPELCSTNPESMENSSHISKILGLFWDKRGDTFVFNTAELAKSLSRANTTKRAILSGSSKVFDPLGWLGPALILAKQLMQKIWQDKYGWDEQVRETIAKLWQEWLSTLNELDGLQIQRQIDAEDSNAMYQLHLFCDASAKAYGAVAYLRTETESGVTVHLVMSKARVTPLKQLTIPKLELLGAVLAARLVSFLHHHLQISVKKTFLWTDSAVTLYWIHNVNKRWKPFVQNRLQEIRSLTETNQWYHCPGGDNPADLVSRGLPGKKLKSCELWWKGPCWLSESQAHWPLAEDFGTPPTSHLDDFTEVVTVNVCAIQQIQVLNDENFSRLDHLLRVTAWVKRFLHNVRNDKDQRRSGPLTSAEVMEAEVYWILVVQQRHFSSELAALQSNRMIGENSKLISLRPYISGQILRAKGRITHSHLDEESKNPIILPNKDHWVDLLIRSTHGKLFHGGVGAVLTALRQRFHVLQPRHAIKRVIGGCSICRRLDGPAAMAPPAPPLPADRVTEAAPFAITGIDFAGPLLVRQGKAQEKAYIALFTCANTRAIHLELVSSLCTPAFLLALRRFFSRRGLCRIIYSDNARTFKRADKDLQKLWSLIKDPDSQQFYSQCKITWKYSLECAPWWGGFWERMVRCVKIALRKGLQRCLLTFEEMITVLAEVEGILNMRPLTFVYSSPDEPYPLTPNHFMLGQASTPLPPEHKVTQICRDSSLTKRWQYRQRLINAVNSRWKQEYLTELRAAHQAKKSSGPLIAVGDVVLIQDDKRTRLQWRMGLVESVKPGRDGNIRSASVRVVVPKPHVIRRAVQHLYPIESSVDQ